jgi:hypothetical protein
MSLFDNLRKGTKPDSTIHVSRSGAALTHKDRVLKECSEALDAGLNVRIETPTVRCDDTTIIEKLRAAFSHMEVDAYTIGCDRGYDGLHAAFGTQKGTLWKATRKHLELPTLLHYLSSLWAQRPTVQSITTLTAVANRYNLCRGWSRSPRLMLGVRVCSRVVLYEGAS